MTDTRESPATENGSKPEDRTPNGRFAPGHAPIPGNGRKPGSKNWWTCFLELMERKAQAEGKDEGELVLEAVLAMAKGGDIGAAKILFDRLLPALQRLEHSGSVETGALKLSDEQLTAILEGSKCPKP